MDIEKKAVEFEKKHGSMAFIKAVISAINKLLVAKNIVSKYELETALFKEMSQIEKEAKNDE